MIFTVNLKVGIVQTVFNEFVWKHNSFFYKQLPKNITADSGILSISVKLHFMS